MGNDGYRGDFNTSSGTNGIVRRSDGILCTNTSSSVSKRQYKTDISDMDQVLPVVMQLRPRNFKWTDELVNTAYQEDVYDLQVQNQYGFIVEEVVEVLPDLVHHEFTNGSPSPYMWKSNAVLAVAIKAIQELNIEIQSLKEQVAALGG